MIRDKKFCLTKEGIERLKKEYQELKNLKALKTEGEMPKILHSEDLNPEYLSLQEDLGFLEFRLSELKNILENFELIKTPLKSQRNTVGLGATVTLTEPDGQMNEFMIVDSLEANPNEGKISAESPVGKAILGKKIGEEVIITSPIKVVYKIKKIKYHLS
jgi:transcription elongation factor GreA